jgi:hypothetical protein
VSLPTVVLIPSISLEKARKGVMASPALSTW